MKFMTGHQVRRTFLDYFVAHNHLEYPSSSLIPHGDPTLLFTSAGMVQFKPYFMGIATPPSRRLTTAQKCFRTGDIETVGNERNLTFFEMLGNFSIGDYFKREAIAFAWELLTEGYGLEPERLYPTVHPTDDEAVRLWQEVAGVPLERITRLEDNWWGPAGETGPCGPDSEIYYDRGPEFNLPGDGNCPGSAGPRFLEVWNLVFMQYNRGPNGRDTPLPRPSIDTGMGLERMTMLLQGKRTVYETDLFLPILEAAQSLSGVVYGRDEKKDFSLRVIAEHSRAIAFLIADGVLPSNEGRGYVLRRILRRAVRHGHYLGLRENFLVKTADVVINHMGDHYKELKERRDFIARVIDREESLFRRTLEQGEERFATVIAQVRSNGEAIIPGSEVFKLYDTFGFPIDIARDMAHEHGLSIDQTGFETALQEQRQRARAAAKFGLDTSAEIYRQLGIEETTFLGYDTLTAETRIVAMLKNGEPIDTATEGDEVEIVLEATPFYGEQGGQVGDTGTIASSTGRIEVRDTQKPLPDLIVHRGVVAQGYIQARATVTASVDEGRRRDIMRNHTATHLLHRALRTVLGEHAQQRGSLVAPDRLRFDFAHLAPVTPDEIRRIEEMVNAAIRADYPVEPRYLPQQEALAAGAMALFGEKYGDIVRMVTVGDGYSRELCGGTHLNRTGEIGFFIITSESSVGAGLRRIEALTGRGAEAYIRERLNLLNSVAHELGVQPSDVLERVHSLLADLAEARREVERLRRESAKAQVADILATRTHHVAGITVVAARVEVASVEGLREMTDWLRDRLGSGIIVLGALINQRPTFVAAITEDLVAKGYSAGVIVRDVATLAGGSGGGPAKLAQGGGKDPERLDAALAAVTRIIEKISGGDVHARRR